MLSANYTSEKICRALGLGGFANDERLAEASESIRLLLTPSFHPEVCITFTRGAEGVRVQVVAAAAQIWHQSGVAPRRTSVESGEAPVDDAVFDELGGLLIDAGQAPTAQWVILDGMSVHSVLRSGGQGLVDLARNAREEDGYLGFVSRAVGAAWRCVDLPRARNALRDTGAYVGLDLPLQDVPAPKQAVQIAVMGDESTAQAILDGLAARHPRRG